MASPRALRPLDCANFLSQAHKLLFLNMVCLTVALACDASSTTRSCSLHIGTWFLSSTTTERFEFHHFFRRGQMPTLNSTTMTRMQRASMMKYTLFGRRK
jgi:hypothetical protein